MLRTLLRTSITVVLVFVALFSGILVGRLGLPETHPILPLIIAGFVLVVLLILEGWLECKDKKLVIKDKKERQENMNRLIDLLTKIYQNTKRD